MSGRDGDPADPTTDPTTGPPSDRTTDPSAPDRDRDPDRDRAPGPHPPRLTDALLRRVLPEGVRGASIRADLLEEFREVAGERGERAARMGYRRAALSLCGAYLRPGRRPRRASAIAASTGATSSTTSSTAASSAPVASPSLGGGGNRESLATLGSDFRFAVRTLLRTPLLSLVAVVTVALGVGITTLTYSIVDGSALRGIPVPGADRLRAIHRQDTRDGSIRTSLRLDELEILDRASEGFESLAGVYEGTANLAGDDAPPERFAGAFVTADALTVLGVPPLLGRTFRPGEDGPDEPARVVLAHETWAQRFAGDPAVVGRSIRLNGETAEVVGVMPPGFAFPFQADLWTPHRYDPEDPRAMFAAFGRTREGLDAARADETLRAAMEEMARVAPERHADMVLRSMPFTERYMPPQITAVMFLMLAATFGVLLIACANVANLLVARATTRAREIAIRTALGASRARVVRQIMVEAMTLTVVGGVLGTALAYVGVHEFSRATAAIPKPFWIVFRVDGPALAFALGSTLIAGVAAGLLPALRASGFGVGAVLKDESRGSSSLSLGRLSHGLVVTEIAVSSALLIASGLMVRSVLNVQRVDLGFEAAHVMTARVGLFETDYPAASDREGFFRRLESEVEALPGVRAAALATQLPGLGGGMLQVGVEGRVYADDRDRPVVNATFITSGFFDAADVRVLRGRGLGPTETWSADAPVALVNESFVERVLDGADPLDRYVRFAEGPDGAARVVGVVPDLHVGGNVGGIGDDRVAPEHVYLPVGVSDPRFLSVMARVDGAPASLGPALRETVARLDPDLPLYDVIGLVDAMSDATWAFRMFGSLFTIFGVAALFMACVGLYGVMAFSVGQRRREMGVRMALGAGGGRIMRMVVGQGSARLVLGASIGVVLGYLMARPLAAVTFGVDPFDPWVYGLIVGTMLLTGLAATLVPARSATRADPVEAMRPR